MRDTKSSSLIKLSLLLLFLSLIFLSIWAYSFYRATQKQKKELVKDKLPPAAIFSNNIRDSLLKIYTATIDELDSRIDSTKISADSLLGNVDNKLMEINKLKEEISIILKNKSSLANLDTAREKIDELQLKISQLQNRNLNFEKENKRLKSLLQQLISDKNNTGQNSNRLPVTDKMANGKTTLAPIFTVADIRLSALVVKDDKEETLQGEETEKLSGFFVVKSNNYANNAANIIVVVLQPNGKVLQNSTWESGTFDTPDGRKIYSLKLHFDYIKGEDKQLQFSLSTDKFMKGNYIVQVYSNGLVIGKIVKYLS